MMESTLVQPILARSLFGSAAFQSHSPRFCSPLRRLPQGHIRSRQGHPACSRLERVRLVDISCQSWKSWLLEEWGWGDTKMMIASLDLRKERSTFVEYVSAGTNRFFLETEPTLPKRKTQQVLVFIGRALLILGLGLSLSKPALAWPFSSRTTTTSAGNSQTSLSQKDPGDIIHEQEDENVALHVSDESDVAAGKSQTNQIGKDESAMMKGEAAKASPTIWKEAEERLGDKFWSGIPSPEGSRLYSLKLQLDRYPNDVRALGVLLHAVMDQRDMHRAITVLEKMVDVQPEELEWKFMKAWTHECIGELLMAKAGYEELLRLRPLSARVLQGLVTILNQIGEGRKAFELIETALERALIENKDVEGRNLRMLLGQFYTQKGKFEDAMKQYNMMIDQDPNDFRPYLCQGLVYSLLGEDVKSEKCLEKYRQLCPPDFPNRNYLDDLMFNAKTAGRMDEMSRKVAKSAVKGKKEPKLMQPPSIFGTNKEGEEQADDDL